MEGKDGGNEKKEVKNWRERRGKDLYSSRLTTKSVINDNANLASLRLLQTDGRGTRRGVTLMCCSALARRAQIHLPVHSDHSAALQPD